MYFNYLLKFKKLDHMPHKQQVLIQHHNSLYYISSEKKNVFFSFPQKCSNASANDPDCSTDLEANILEDFRSDTT